MSRFHLEHLLYALAFGLALFLRLLNLGAVPLSDREAALALQARAVVAPSTAAPAASSGQFDSQAPAGGSRAAGSQAAGFQPGYVAATALTFLTFPETNFLARFWPALAGSLLVLAPWFFTRPSSQTRRLGLDRTAGLIMAFGLAIDPGLVTLSRQAGGLMPAVTFTTLALGAGWAGLPWLAGLSAGLALLSGPTFFYGLVGLGLAGLGLRLWPQSRDETASLETGADAVAAWGRSAWRNAGLAALVTALLAGSLFGLHLEGLNGLLSALPRYLSGWLALPEVTALQLAAALLVYQPFALLFGILGVVRLLRPASRAGNSRLAIFWVFWTVAALLLALLYPARQVSDLAWVLVPLWGLAAFELAHYLPAGRVNPLAGVQAAGILLLGALFWLNLSGLAAYGAGQDFPVRVAFFFGLAALGTLLTVLVALGWSWELARLGLVWGLAATAILYLVAVGWGSSQVRAHSPAELWNPGPAAGQEDLLLDTLGDLSTWQTGFPQTLEILSTVDSPSLQWSLRGYSSTWLVDAPPAGAAGAEDLPPVIISRPDEAPPALAAAYRGQDFTWWVYPAWTGTLPSPLARWLVFREAPLAQDLLVLWARSDLFPGGTIQP